METESEKICDLPKSRGEKYQLDRVRKSEFWSLFGEQGSGSHHLPSLGSSAFTYMEQANVRCLPTQVILNL